MISTGMPSTANAVDTQLLIGGHHALQRCHQVAHGLFTDKAGTENAFAQTGDLPVFGQNPDGLLIYFRRHHAYRVAADVNSRVAGHSSL
jgi:hypothetical protein